LPRPSTRRASSKTMSQRSFIVSKQVLSRYKTITKKLSSLGANEILLDIDKFAFTANNMTYAHAGGPPLNYWNFYDNLLDDNLRKENGIIPVWGFATCTKSRNPIIAEGSRHYGFYPMASSVVYNPSKASTPSFTVARSDSELAAVYNSYLNTETDPFYASLSCENAMMVYRPLFLTSFFLDDYCSSKHQNVGHCVLTSASSKTAFGLAFQLRQRGVTVIGLTSERNLGFCESLGLYSGLYTYDSIGDIQSNETTVVVDMAGSHDVNLSIDKHFGTRVVESIGVGMTHNTVLFGDRTTLSDHAQATRKFFFAPAWIRRRIEEDATIMERAASSYVEFTQRSEEKRWLEFNTNLSVEEVYALSESNSVNPNQGLITRVQPTS